jgi:L-aspartate oxidase
VPTACTPTEWTVAGAVLAAAAARTESRGCHHRDDHPLRSEWWRRSVHGHRAETGLPAVVVDDVASAA